MWNPNVMGTCATSNTAEKNELIREHCEFIINGSSVGIMMKAEPRCV